jgi:hypothetical protein
VAATRNFRRLMFGEAAPDAAVFVSCKGGPLDASEVHRIVKAAAERAGLSAEVSAYWLHHAHASHSLDRGAPIHRCSRPLATSPWPPLGGICRTRGPPLKHRLRDGSRLYQHRSSPRGLRPAHPCGPERNRTVSASGLHTTRAFALFRRSSKPHGLGS